MEMDEGVYLGLKRQVLSSLTARLNTGIASGVSLSPPSPPLFFPLGFEDREQRGTEQNRNGQTDRADEGDGAAGRQYLMICLWSTCSISCLVSSTAQLCIDAEPKTIWMGWRLQTCFSGRVRQTE